jgi:hypothetical protein
MKLNKYVFGEIRNEYKNLTHEEKTRYVANTLSEKEILDLGFMGFDVDKAYCYALGKGGTGEHIKHGNGTY